ncbi:MAG: UDP-N-acetylmuramate dehydrogenase [Elusimicrobia bacterium]|nr:UDP-N-acetylmuramate dehydrogenase [Elusimicrobiota bacterium]MBU2613956.1 UDP-N-acetylmuramate dehydrogenase [Elusimicrobiota bacterium]
MKLKIKQEFSGRGFEIKFDEPLAKHTTFRTGGPAAAYLEAKSVENIADALAISKTNSFPVFFIGAGSNVLFSDSGFDGIVIRLKDKFGGLEFIEQANNILVKAGAGVTLPLLVKKCADSGASGLEALAGVPGTVGGALVMNAGTRSGTISDKLVKVTIVNSTGALVDLKKEEVVFDYRHSSLEGQIILFAEFLLAKTPKEAIVKRITENMIKRSETQPLGTLNAGSIFKNPKNKQAGRIIEDCGLKGFKIGGAQISQKHANFIINTGNAKSSDILQIIDTIKTKVKEKFGIELETEIKIV